MKHLPFSYWKKSLGAPVFSTWPLLRVTFSRFFLARWQQHEWMKKERKRTRKSRTKANADKDMLHPSQPIIWLVVSLSSNSSRTRNRRKERSLYVYESLSFHIDYRRFLSFPIFLFFFLSAAFKLFVFADLLASYRHCVVLSLIDDDINVFTNNQTPPAWFLLTGAEFSNLRRKLSFFNSIDIRNHLVSIKSCRVKSTRRKRKKSLPFFLFSFSKSIKSSRKAITMTTMKR